LWLSIAAVLAPLLSIVIFSGVPFHLMALHKNRSAALRSRLAVSRKSGSVAKCVLARILQPIPTVRSDIGRYLIFATEPKYRIG
jgi:hypothetical protein